MTGEATIEAVDEGHQPPGHRNDGSPQRAAVFAAVFFAVLFFAGPALVLLVVIFTPEPEVGKVAITVGGDLSGDDYTIHPQATANSDSTEHRSMIELTIDGRTTEPEIPAITAQVGTSETTCKSVEGDWWYYNLEDYESQTFVVTLECDPFVSLSQFRATPSATIVNH